MCKYFIVQIIKFSIQNDEEHVKHWQAFFKLGTWL